MRIPFPERVPINRAILFSLVLFTIQRLEGTDLFFATGCAIFILLTAFAFNAAGGLTRASGAYVFFYSVLVVLIGILYKAFLGEPAQSNLLDPHLKEHRPRVPAVPQPMQRACHGCLQGQQR